MDIGARLKTLRTAKKVTIKALSEATGLSVGFISNIERDVNNPTINSLMKICTALDIDMQTFFSLPDSASTVMRKSDRQTLHSPGHPATICEIFPKNSNRLQPSFITMEPGATYGDSPTGHGDDEICLILQGKVEFYLSDDTYLLEEGDCIYVNSFASHAMKNVGDVPASTYWITERKA